MPSQRALIMLSIVMLSIFWRYKVKSTQVLSFALLAVLLLDPIAVLSPGFWLSFMAVAIIGLAAFGRLAMDKNWLIWGRLQWRISLALIPLLIFLFQQASLVSPLTNLVAIPIVSFIVVPMVLLATTVLSFTPYIADMMYVFADTTLSVLWWFLSYLADTSVSQWYGTKPNVLSLCLASLGIALLLAPKSWPAKYFGLFFILPLLWPNTNSPNENEVRITLLDVGQGLAAVVQTAHHTLVFDTGPKFSESFDTGAAVVIPFIRQNNIQKLDVLIVSHKDNDHSGGVQSIKGNVEIDSIMSSYGLLDSERCLSGQQWLWDGVMFEILSPNESTKYKKRNNSSCVLRISCGEQSLLLSADIEKKTEMYLVKHQFDKLKSTYLVAPHHGSKTSSSQDFLNVVNPEYIFVPVGFRNRYKMPHSSVLQRYNERDVPVYETYKTGAISVKFGQKNISQLPILYRNESRKYWNSHH